MKYEEIFRANVDRLMREQRLTKSELAERAGISVSFVSEITAQKGNPSLKIMSLLAEALAVPLPLLLLESPGEMWSFWYATERCKRQAEATLSSKLPPGLEEVTVVLPVHKAFLAKKWARQAKKDRE